MRPRYTPAARLSGLALVAMAAAITWEACSSPAPTPTPVPTPTPAAPALTCPADITRQSPDDGSVAIAYQTPTATDGTLPVTVTCTPPSGSAFAPGTTAVRCTAVDAIGRQATCGFGVRITLVPRLGLTKFLGFGDSMTMGVLSMRAPLFPLTPSPTSYPGRLLTLLAARYTAQTITMDDEGVQGEEAINALRRLPGVLGTAHPEVVLLLDGVNDLNAFGEAGLEDTAWAMDQMIVATIDSGAVPFLATLPPQRQGGFRAASVDLVAPYNARLASIAAATRTTLVDVYAAFGGVASTDLIGPDGLHPTEAGYEKIAETFLDAIRTRLEVASPAVRTRLR